MLARIYRPTKSATQSGQARTHRWVLEFAPEKPKVIDPLMGWTGSADTLRQVRMEFDTREAAEAYARENGIGYVVVRPREMRHHPRPRGYGENFAPGRRMPWTH
ncbi:MAG: ETC complex I subunit [Alphaproteobacteria bacterium]|nr:MAG: ETC complex I subunit [Alphaproteobacteria bacterium]